MLTDTLRAQLAARANVYLNTTCAIARETVTAGVYGESDRQFTLIAADVPCRLIGPKYDRRTLIVDGNGREDARTEYRLVIPLTAAALQVKDRVTIAGQTYRVTQVPAQWTDLPFQQVQVSSGEAGSD